MPYLKQENKSVWILILFSIEKMFIKIGEKLVAGTLNYLFTKIAHLYIKVKGENYQNYNDIIGALEGAKLELYRRKIVPYENKKIKSNGDV